MIFRFMFLVMGIFIGLTIGFVHETNSVRKANQMCLEDVKEALKDLHHPPTQDCKSDTYCYDAGSLR